ncbi:MAG: hypothetical protein JWO03_2875 [Bacteroidetes bacterium]|nr:hypothetical protein [Bacteroidota bacterium]
MEPNYIQYKGKNIAVNADIQFEVNSPFDDKETLTIDGTTFSTRGQYSLPFTFQCSGVDLAALGHPQLLQRIGTSYTLDDVTLISRGVTIGPGQIVITKVQQNKNLGTVTIEANFYFQSGIFYDRVLGKKVNSLLMDGKRTITATGSRQNFTGSGVSFTDPMVIDIYEFNTDGSNGTDYFPASVHPSSSMTDSYATTITTAGDDYICFPTIYVPDDNVDSGFRYINYWYWSASRHASVAAHAKTIGAGAAGAAFNSTITGYTCSEVEKLNNSIVPMYFYWQILKHCFSEFGYTLDMSNGILADEQFRKAAIVNTWDILNDWMVMLNNINDTGESFFSGYYQDTTTIDPANHLPDMDILDFLTNFSTEFNLIYIFKGNKVTIRHNQLGKPVEKEMTVGPEILSEPNITQPGVSISYNTSSGDVYADLKNFTDTVKKLPEPSNPLPLVHLVKYINPLDNSIEQRINTGDTDKDYLCQNLIPYSDVAPGHTFTLELPPVTQKMQAYADLSPDLTETEYKVFMPVMALDVQVFPTVQVLYDFVRDSFDTYVQQITGLWLLGDGSHPHPSAPTDVFSATGGAQIQISFTDTLLVPLVVHILQGPFTSNPVVEEGDGSVVITGPHGPYSAGDIVTVTQTSTGHFHISVEHRPRYTQTYSLDTQSDDTRGGSATFHTGFYWGLQGTGELVAAGKTFPYMSNHDYAPGQAFPRIGWFSLALVGEHGLVANFWKGFINQFTLNEKRTFNAPMPLHEIMAFDFSKAKIVDGRRYYVSRISFQLPHIRDAIVEIWCI